MTLAHVAAEETALNEAAGLLRARPEELPERIRALLDERKQQANEIAELRRRLALAGGPAETKGPETVAGVRFLAQKLTGVSGKDLRGLIDEHKARLKSGVILLVADTYNHRLKHLDPRTRECHAWVGSGEPGYRDGTATDAQFYEPSGLSLPVGHGRVYVADTNNHRVRIVERDTGAVSTLELRDAVYVETGRFTGGQAVLRYGDVEVPVDIEALLA